MTDRAKSYSFRPPSKLGQDIEALAEQNGVSVNAWMIAELARAVEANANWQSFMRRRAIGKSISDNEALRYLKDWAQDAPPLEGDELPDGWPETSVSLERKTT